MDLEFEAKVYVIVLNWNGWKDTIECVESIAMSDYENLHIVVCDNDSQDGSLGHIKSWLIDQSNISERSDKQHLPPVQETTLLELAIHDTPITLIQTGSNLGYAGGNNVGIRHAIERGDCDFIWILNPDTVVQPDAARKMINHSNQLSLAGTPNTCGSLICFYEQKDTIQALGGSTFNRWTGIANDSEGKGQSIFNKFDHHSTSRRLDYILGCSWMIPRQFIEDIGYMEEGYFLFYEEADWALRSAHKYQLTYCPDAVVYHKSGSSTGDRSLNTGPSPSADFYLARSRKRFMKKFFPTRLPAVYIGLFLQSINRLRQKRFRNAVQIMRVAVGFD